MLSDPDSSSLTPIPADVEADLRWRLTLSAAVELRTFEGGRDGHLWIDAGSDLAKAALWAVAKNIGGHGVYATYDAFAAVPSRPASTYASAGLVAGRAAIYIDADPRRPKGQSDTSATDAQRAAAARVMDDALAYLAGHGWGEPARRWDSGSGQGALFLCEPGLTDDRVNAVLAALNVRFSTECGKIDTTTYNLSRVCRLLGSLNVKGESYRRCVLLAEAAEPVTVTAAMCADAAGPAEERVPFAAETTPRWYEAPPEAGNLDLPGADFNRHGDWFRHLLDPIGAKLHHTDARGVMHITRPGKEPKDGSSATLGHFRAKDGTPVLFPFTDAWPELAGWKPVDLFGAYTRLFHKGNFREATKALRGQGWGKPLPPKARILWGGRATADGPVVRHAGPGAALPADGPGEPPAGATPGDPVAGAGSATEPAAGAEPAQPPPPGGGPSPDPLEDTITGQDAPDGSGRVVILLNPNESTRNDAGVTALARDPEVYQAGGLLVAVRPASEGDPASPITRPPTLPVMVPIEPALVRDRLTAQAFYVTERTNRKGETSVVHTHPTPWHVQGVFKRTRWPGVRDLAGLSPFPAVVQGGRVLVEPGYDPRTGLFLAPNVRVSPPASPTRGDAEAAVRRLMDVVADFPFAADCHKAAWLAGLLTPLAWFSFTGPAPFFVTTGNGPGIGKGKLLHCIGMILTGEPFPVSTYDNDDPAEFRKLVTACAIAGDRTLLLDNLDGEVGNAQLAAALTAARKWRDRVLSVSKTYDGPLNLVLYGSGNNVSFVKDAGRRVCPIVMESLLASPETRDDIREDDILGYIGRHRAELLTAAVTILAAYHAAGAPAARLAKWGSYEGFTAAVRQPVMWAMGVDPAAGRPQLKTTADDDQLRLNAVIEGWRLADPGGRGLTAARAIEEANRGEGGADDWRAAFREALGRFCHPLKVDPTNLGTRLRSAAKRVTFGGRRMVSPGLTGGVARWVVEEVSQPPEPDLYGGVDGAHEGLPD